MIGLDNAGGPFRRLPRSFGFYGEQMAVFACVNYRIESRDCPWVCHDRDGLTQRRIALRLADEKGRDWEVTGRRIAKFVLPLDGFMIHETMFEYQTREGRVGYGLSERGVRL